MSGRGEIVGESGQEQIHPGTVAHETQDNRSRFRLDCAGETMCFGSSLKTRPAPGAWRFFRSSPSQRRNRTRSGALTARRPGPLGANI